MRNVLKSKKIVAFLLVLVMSFSLAPSVSANTATYSSEEEGILCDLLGCSMTDQFHSYVTVSAACKDGLEEWRHVYCTRGCGNDYYRIIRIVFPIYQHDFEHISPTQGKCRNCGRLASFVR